jgi:hypothetical protein
MWYLYTMEFYAAMKEKMNFSSGNWYRAVLCTFPFYFTLMSQVHFQKPRFRKPRIIYVIFFYLYDIHNYILHITNATKMYKPELAQILFYHILCFITYLKIFHHLQMKIKIQFNILNLLTINFSIVSLLMHSY